MTLTWDLDIWKDWWIDQVSFMIRFLHLYLLEMEKECLVKDRWEGNNWCWNWKKEIREGVKLLQLFELMEVIHSFQPFDSRDIWILDG